MGYFLWNILKGNYDEIKISFLPVGHTKFGVDWAFGLFKQRFRVESASCIEDVANIVKMSTPTSEVNQAVQTGTENGQVLVPVYDWNSYFQNKHWKTITQITSYFHFRFTKEEPGFVYTKKKLEDSSWVKHRITTDTSCPVDFPNEIQPDGLTRERKDYLFKKIRPYCPGKNKDVLCPNPEENFNEDDENDEEENVITQPPASKRSRRRLM